MLVYGQQFFIIILAALFFFQILTHQIIFWLFEKTKIAKNAKLQIELDAGSQANEFGLEHWNHALNNVYWFLALGLLIPVVSRLSQPDPSRMDVGQMMIRFIVPLLVLAPMIVTIISRQNKLPRVWALLNQQTSVSVTWQTYHEQRLWPIDKNWSSKFGIIIALAFASFLFGAEVLKITGL